MRIPFARSIALRAASASASESASSRSARSSSCRAVAVAIAGQQVGLAERLHEVAEDAGLDRARHELALAVGGHHHDRDRPLVEDPPRRLDPVEPRHLHVEERDVGLGLARELDRLLAVARLGAHLEAGRLEQPLEVEPDDRLVLGDEDARHAGNTTSARRPPSFSRASSPRSSSRTSARTIESPVPRRLASMPAAVVRDRQDDVSVALRERDRDVLAAVLERVLEELGEDERERRRALARERHRLELGRDVLPGDEPLHEHRAQAVDELAEVDVVLAMLGEHLVHGRDREDPVDGVVERLPRVDVLRARLQAEQRRDRLEVVLHAVVDLLREDAAHDRPAVLERDGGVVRDRLEQRLVVGGERRVAIADELADLTPLPAQRQAHGVRARATLGPRDLPVLEHERGAGRVQRLHRRLHDRLERLLEVERLGDRLRDPGERLELRDAPLRPLVELRVLDRLRDLRRDRDEELDLGVGERARLARADVERALERVAGEDRDGEDRLVLVLRAGSGTA